MRICVFAMTGILLSGCASQRLLLDASIDAGGYVTLRNKGPVDWKDCLIRVKSFGPRAPRWFLWRRGDLPAGASARFDLRAFKNYEDQRLNPFSHQINQLDANCANGEGWLFAQEVAGEQDRLHIAAGLGPRKKPPAGLVLQSPVR
ncbi:MAG: hypothetical protein ACLPKB_33260 [Xanthobacteraceae bacterium]